MARFSWLISKYLIQAVVPYFIFSWLLLSVILFVQQAGQFSDIFFSVNIPGNLVWQLTLALIPNVIAFTCPMAVLVGVIIGLSKMQGDSELVAIRAAGVGNFQITLPVLILGILLSIFAFVINLYGVPLAAAIVRQVAMQTAIYKLESPIEPGVFNTEVAGYTIYVKDGDIREGRWKNIFIYNEDTASGITRLITSSSGRIDSTDQLSELVLENAIVSTFSRAGISEDATLVDTGVSADQEKYVSESLGEIRFAIKTKRGELIEKLSASQGTPEELGLSALSSYAQSKEGKERTEAQILWQRRMILSITPLIFCLLGTALILRFSRGGRGFGILLALASLIGYYLLAFLGEQLARTERISVFEGSLIPIAVSVFAILWFNFAGRFDFWRHWWDKIREVASEFKFNGNKVTRRGNLFVDLTTGLRDFDIVLNLLRYYALTLVFLTAIFVIFTAFELWKFAGTMDGGIWLLVKYLFFLLPFIYVQLAPSAAMIAVLATYVIKSRQNEIVTWTSAGQSVYRLLLPCILLMIMLGVINWQVQERLLPRANQMQDHLRAQLRRGGVMTNKSGKFWVANNDRIYSFEIDENASDNAKTVRNLTVYGFADNEPRLQFLYRVPQALWQEDRIKFTGEARKSVLSNGKIETVKITNGELVEASNPFEEMRKKPSHLTIFETRAQIANSESELEQRSFAVALEKKYTTVFLPFIIALFTAPFALSLSRKGKVVTVGYAVGLLLLFMGATSVFEQFGQNGFLSPTVAIWSPLVLFAMLGVYLMSKIKT